MKNILTGLALTIAVTALPDGAPVCNIGDANVQNKHLIEERNPETGPIEMGQYQAILSGRLLMMFPTDPTFANLFDFSLENLLVIQSGVDSYMKGILVVASGGDRSEIDSLDTRTPQALTITDPDLTKESIGCEKFAVSSITHTEPSEKSVIAMSFKWQIEGQRLFLDVNIVKNNNSTAGSQYYFTRYPMQASDINLPKKCGLFGLQTFCPCLQCGLLGRILRLCDPNQC